MGDLRLRPLLSQVTPQFENDGEECPRDDPENYVFPEKNVRSFVGPYILLQLDHAPNLGTTRQQIKCTLNYEFKNCRIWDQIIDNNDHGRGFGLFKYNLTSQFYGPDIRSSKITMCLPQAKIAFKDNFTTYQQKHENYNVFQIRNANVLRKPIYFTNAIEAIPYRGKITFRKNIGSEAKILYINVEKYQKKSYETTLSLGSYSSDTQVYKRFSNASRCLIVIINQETKTMTIDIIQNTPVFYQEKNSGLIPGAPQQQELLCSYDSEQQRKREYKLSGKELLEIAIQILIHIGSIYALKLRDEMHFKLMFDQAFRDKYVSYDKFKDIKKSTKHIKEIEDQRVSIGVLNLGIKGKTKYEEYFPGLSPEFYCRRLKSEKTFLHPLAYRFWARNLPMKKLREMIQEHKDVFIQVFSVDSEFNTSFNFTAVDIQDPLGFSNGTFEDRTINDLFSFLAQPKLYLERLTMFLTSRQNGAWQEKIFTTYSKSQTDLLTYFLVDVLKQTFNSKSLDEKKTALGPISQRILEDLRNKFGANLDLDTNITDQFKPKKVKTVMRGFNTVDLITNQSILALEEFNPFQSDYFTNNFMTKISELEILKWDVVR